MADLTKVTLNLTARSSTALDRLVNCTGDSKTDVINRALRVYEWLIDTPNDTGRLRYIGPDGTQEVMVII